MDRIWHIATHVVLFVSIWISNFDSAVISIAIIVAIFCNLGESSGEGVSAYSVFNKGFRRLIGDTRADEIDKQLRGTTQSRSNSKDQTVTERLGIPSKFMNRPCICGSGLKAKKCCSASSKRKAHSSKDHPEHEFDFRGFEVIQQ